MSKVAGATLKGKRVWVTGHLGMVGAAMVRALAGDNAEIVLTSRRNLDLRDQAKTLDWIIDSRPDFIFHIAAKVGGIGAIANSPADFLRDNLLIQANVLEGAYRANVQKLIFVASNCIYPQASPQPIGEDCLLMGDLEDNIRPYGISKIAGIELCRAYRRQHGCNFVIVVPANLYGPNDNYSPESSHVVAGIMRRAHEAKVSGAETLTIWGDGTPRRELLYVDDLARALKLVMEASTQSDIFNVGCGYDLPIARLAELVCAAVGFEGKLHFDISKPNGAMSKLLDSSRIRELGWRPEVSEELGLQAAYGEFVTRGIPRERCGELSEV